MTMTVRSGVALLLAGILSACATDYQKEGATGGYTEKKISDSAYEVSFLGNGFTSEERVYYFWVYRCAELTLQNGFELFTLSSPSASRQTPVQGESATAQPAVFRSDEQGSMVRTAYTAVPIFIPGGGGNAHWTHRGLVRMYHKPLSAELLWAVDAQRTVDELKAFVTSGGKAPAPKRADVFTAVFTAHERVVFGTHAEAQAIAERPASDPAPAPKPARTLESITDALNGRRVIAFHAAYRDYVTRTADRHPAPGDVVVEFAISPNGPVTECTIVASSFTDKTLTDSVAAAIRQTDFGPRDVSATGVSNFKVQFISLD